MPRLTLGKHAMSGMSGLSCGDVFAWTVDSRLWVLTSSGNGWSLRELKPDGSADYSKPPHPLFIDVPSHWHFVDTVNYLADHAGHESWGNLTNP
jgi:hypothetical protein